MRKIDKILHEVEELSTAEKWRLVRLVLGSLQQAQEDAAIQHPESEIADWHQFLRETYGSLRDTPIERWDPGAYEQREQIE